MNDSLNFFESENAFFYPHATANVSLCLSVVLYQAACHYSGTALSASFLQEGEASKLVTANHINPLFQANNILFVLQYSLV
jgi:hypothetical protein